MQLQAEILRRHPHLTVGPAAVRPVILVLMLAIALAALFGALHYIPPAHGEPFDWDRYHARQDACLEKDRIVADCARGLDYCDELALRQATRACSPFGPLRERDGGRQ